MAEGQSLPSAAQHHFPLGTGSSDFTDDFQRYFGPPVDELRPSPYDKVAHSNYTLEERYKNRNLFVKDTIDGLITRADRWYTTLALPWAETDQHHIQWNTWTFNRTLAGRVPHEGISRLVTTSKMQKRAHVVRRGLAFVIEGDDFRTPEGQEQYRRNVLGIAQSVQETQDHDTVYALLTSKTYERVWEQLYGRMGYSFFSLLQNEIGNYASVIQDPTRLEIVVERHKQVLARLGVEPDLLIVSPSTSVYMTMVPPAKTQYWTAGPDGPLTLKQGPDAMKTFRGINVFEAREFDVYSPEPAIQLLTRPRQISEYYGMLAKEYRSGSVEGYRTSWRDTYLYSENKDNFVKIHFIDAFKQLRLFAPDGNYHQALKRLVQSYRDEGRVPPRIVSGMPGDDGMDERRGGGRDGEADDAFFLAAPDNDNLYFLIEYFGQMDLSKASAKDFEQAGRTIVQQIFSDESGELETWQDMIRLIHEIESQGYDHNYWLALVRVNEPRSIDQQGTFIGERTPDDLIDGWGMQAALSEWAPNSMGSLALPREGLEDVEFPAGFANGPGLKTLAKEANRSGSPWHEIGKRAQNAVNLIERFLGELQRMLPTSEAMREENRSPWFHRGDAFTTLFETLVSTRRDPIWLAALPAVTDPESGRVRGATSGGGGAAGATSGGDREIRWFPVPLFVVSSGALAAQPEEQVRRALQDLYNGTLPDDVQQALDSGGIRDEGNRKLFVYQSLVTGEEMRIPERFLYRTAMLPREMTVMMLMGRQSLPDLRAIFAVINSDESYPPGTSVAELFDAKRMHRNALLSFIEAYSQTRGRKKADLRRVVSAIALDRRDPATMLQTIRTIHITHQTSTAAKKEAYAKIRELAATLAAQEDDPDLEIGRGLQPLQPPAFTETGAMEPLAGRASLSFRDVKESMDRIFDLVVDVSALRRAVDPGADLVPFSMEPEAFEDWLAVGLGDISGLTATAQGDYTTRYQGLTAELRELVARVQVQIQTAMPEEEDREAWGEEAGARSRRAGRFSVQDDSSAALRSRFYRAPLTMSLALLESLGTAGAAALIRPSDPRTAHTRPYMADLTMTREEREVLPEELWKRPQYASIGSLWLDGRKELEEVGFLCRHAMPAAMQSRSSVSLDDDIIRDPYDDGYFDDVNDGDPRTSGAMEIEHVLGGEGFGEPSSFGIGANFRDPPGGWSKSSLRAGPSASADVRRPFEGPGTRYSARYAKLKTDTFVYRWSQSNDIANAFHRMAVQALLLSRSNGKQWMRALESNILMPINILLWRMEITHDMSTFILMKGGLDTGANLYGHSNFATGNDVGAKLIYGNYTVKTKAVVWHERNVVLIEDAKPERYRGGNNVAFIPSRSDMTELREDIDRPSLIATAIPITENEFPKVMSFTGQLEMPDRNERIDRPAMSYSTADYYDGVVWKLGGRVSPSDPGRDLFFDRSDRFNVHALPGWQALYNRSSNYYNRYVDCQGHRGRNGSYPGAARVWNGDFKFLEHYDFQSLVLE